MSRKNAVREHFQIREPVLHVEVRRHARIDGVGQRNVDANVHAFLGVEIHLLVLRMAFGDVASPFHRLHVGGKFENLGTQRAVDHPSGAHWNFRSSALAAGQIDFDADVPRFDAGDAHEEGQKQNDQQYRAGADDQRFVKIVGAARHEVDVAVVLAGIAAGTAIENGHRNLPVRIGTHPWTAPRWRFGVGRTATTLSAEA